MAKEWIARNELTPSTARSFGRTAGYGAQAAAMPGGDELEFRRMLDLLPIAAYTCDADGLITYFNDRAVALWGRKPALHHPADRYCGSFRLYSADGTLVAHEHCWMALAIRCDAPFHGHEIVIERADGSRRTVLAHASPLHNDESQVVGAVNLLVDITDRKQSEDQLREVDRRKDEFLTLLAHELRNPLAPIRNALQLLNLEEENPQASSHARQIIDRQLRQLVRLVDDLLDTARIQIDKLSLHRDFVDVADVVESAVEASSPLIEQFGHHVSIRLPQEPVVLYADSTRLSQVLGNLLNNAAKFTSPGGHIALEAATDGCEVLIKVQDDGIGIPADRLATIFDLFTQVDSSPERSSGGLGVGLTLSRRLVELHAGTITVKSAGPGRGSEFVVRLPMAHRPPVGNWQEGGGDAKPVRTLQRRILVADDNKDAALALSMLLKTMGSDVRAVYDGRAALAEAEAFQPQVMLLDLGMPELNGYETALSIRQRPWGRHVLLIALTGWGQEEARRRTAEAGFDHHLVKPIDLKELEAILAKLPVCSMPT